MRSLLRTLAVSLLLACVCPGPSSVFATDVDGPNDCIRTPIDFGDAPEGVFAYPGIPGCFPTCLAPGPVGTFNVACPPISTPPGPAGFVRHLHIAAAPQYWLGCIPTNQGIDSEADGKMNATGAPISACSDIPIDCVEAAFGMSFGQDECYGSTDACLTNPVNFAPCDPTSTLTFNVWNCGPSRQIVVNVLIDWNQDGDWNDNFLCNGVCAYEWVAKNLSVVIGTGCTPVTLPAFMSGPNPGDGWMRITISNNPVSDDFPWAGSALLPTDLMDGETEDYPITITHQQTCPYYEDWGDAPELTMAYPSGVIGNFPTCAVFSGPGTQTSACPPISTPPGPTGYVRHLSGPGNPNKFWLGCGAPGIDSEIDGKFNSTGAPASVCNPTVPIDCVEAAFGMSFGQDECYGDIVDAGITTAVTFSTCTSSTVTYAAYNCRNAPQDVFLNILVDWNEDGDWNDNFSCALGCAYEWAVKNVPITLLPGCQTLTSPAFLSGPSVGNGWMRITLTPAPVTDDFPWRGSAAVAGGVDYYDGGETEDYPVKIGNPQNPCDKAYRDFGDAPEGIDAYPGVMGAFPTCIAPGPVGDLDVECGAAGGPPPGPAGFVEHIATATDALHYWLGCAVDDEADGKVNLGGPAGSLSACSAAGPAVDCAEGAPVYGQDECYGDADASLGALITTPVCNNQFQFRYRAYLCENLDPQVFLNILVDWNQDGDWNDNVICKENQCAREWAVKNAPVFMTPGCNFYTTPMMNSGPFVGQAWMRITLSSTPAPADFPWNGTVTSGPFSGGETEDYRIQITPESTGVPDGGGSSQLWLGPVVPNPAFDRVAIDFGLPRGADVTLAAYDLMGRKVAVIENSSMNAGPHHSDWNFRDASGRELPVGQYILKLRVGGEVLTRRVIRMK